MALGELRGVSCVCTPGSLGLYQQYQPIALKTLLNDVNANRYAEISFVPCRTPDVASIIITNLELYTTDERWQVILVAYFVCDKLCRGYGVAMCTSKYEYSM